MLTPDEKFKIIKESLASGYRGSIGDLIEETEKNSLNVDKIAETPEEQRRGLRGEAKDTSMAFTNSSNDFNTVGMTHNINIDKIDDKGNIVQSYRNVPPGIKNLPMGGKVGTVIETPAEYKEGGVYNEGMKLPGSNDVPGELKKFLEQVDKKMAKDKYLFELNREKQDAELYLGINDKQYDAYQMQTGGFGTNFKPTYGDPNNVRGRDGEAYVHPETKEISSEPFFEDQDPSTHLMAHDPFTFEAWPTLFQNKQTGAWFFLENEMARHEASLRGELYKFNDLEEVEDFAIRGNWKNSSKLANHKTLVEEYHRNLMKDLITNQANKLSNKFTPQHLWINKQSAYKSKYQDGGEDKEESLWDQIKRKKSTFLDFMSEIKDSENKDDEKPKSNFWIHDGANVENPIIIKDTRKIRGIDGEPIDPTVDLKSGKYNKDVITQIISIAKYYNVDPALAIAVSLQESRLGKDDGNLGHMLSYDELDRLIEKGSIESFANLPIGSANSHNIYGNDYSYIPYLAYIYNRHNPNSGHKYADVNDGEAFTIQRYNGLGNLYQHTEADYHGGNVKSFYGVDVPPNILYTEEDKTAGNIPDGMKVGDIKSKGYISMKREKLYGKQIIDVRDNIILKNEDILELIENTPAYTTEVKEEINTKSKKKKNNNKKTNKDLERQMNLIEFQRFGTGTPKI